MRNLMASFYSLLVMMLFFTGCQVVGDIFGAGVYTGVFMVVLVIVIIVVIVAKVLRR